MSSAKGDGGMLSTGAGRKPFFSTFGGLYRSDLAFRGALDFAVIGGLAMLFLHPPQSVATILPCFLKATGCDPAKSASGLTSGGSATSATNTANASSTGAGSSRNSGNKLPPEQPGLAAQTTTAPLAPGLVIPIHYPQMFKSPRLGIGFLFDIDAAAFRSSSAETRQRLANALAGVAERKPDDILEALRGADAGDANVALVRGAAFVMRNTEADNRSAEALWRQAVSGGNLQAKALLGRLLISGRPGIRPDQVEGRRLIDEGVAAGDRQAIRFAAIGHLSGDLGQLDPSRAAELLKQAADKGDAMSMAVYSRMLAEGLGVPSPDGKMAEQYLRNAAKAGLTRAQLTLGQWIVAQFSQGLIASPEEAVALFTTAYEKGHALDALNSLTHLHATAAKAPPWKDPAKAFGHARHCSGYQHNVCQFNNGFVWLAGLVGKPNPALARAHYEIARTLGHTAAAAQVQRIDATLTAGQKQEAAVLEKLIRSHLRPVPQEVPLQLAGRSGSPPPSAIAPDRLPEDKTAPVKTAQAAASSVGDTDDFKQCIGAGTDPKPRRDACDRVIKSGKAAKLELGRAYFYRGRAHSILKMYDAAIADYDEALKHAPQLYVAHNNQGTIHLERNQLDKAMTSLNKSLQISPKYKNALANKAEVFRRQGRLTEALAQIGKSLEVDPKYDWARQVQSRIMADIKRLETPQAKEQKKAAAAVENKQLSAGQKAGKASASSADAAELTKLRARASQHLANKDYDSAIADLTDLIRRGNASWEDYNLRGNAYHYKKQYDLALADYDRAVRRGGHGAAPHYNRALIHRRNGKFKEALVDLDAAIIQHLGFIPDYFKERGDIHSRLSNHDQAVKDYGSMIDLLSKSKTATKNSKAYAFYLRGLAKINKVFGDRNKCMSMIPPSSDCNSPQAFMIPLLDFQAALALKPDYAQAHYQTGWIATQFGNTQKAIKSYTAALKADPSYSMAYNNRGVQYSKIGERELAFTDYNDAIRTDPNNKHAWANRGVLFGANRRQRNRAISDLRRALAIDPNYSFAVNALRKLGVRL